MAAAGLALVLVLDAWGVPGLAQSQAAADPASRLATARSALAKGNGIAAEVALRAALDMGAPRGDVAAWMGEAYLAQGNRGAAREWLEAGAFSKASAPSGWRALARLERLDGHSAAADKALDRALALTPKDPGLWVEIGRLRYSEGKHRDAIEAGQRAIALGPQNVRALEFMGQLVRDRYGLLGALPWFEKAIMVDRDDVPVLLAYAATLGDLGRAGQVVTLTRRVLELDPGNARAYYLQAVVAARAGDFALARSLLARTRGRLDGQPAVLQLRGIAELASGNPQAAGEDFEAVLRSKPGSVRTRDLLVRAIYLSGQYRYATLRFADVIARGEASPYMLTVVARAHEVLGERERAGELLDAAARERGPDLHVIALGGRIGRLLGEGHDAQAQAEADKARRASPGFFDAEAQAGDVALVQGNARAAQARYAEAATIRMPSSLFQRRYAAFMLAGDSAGAQGLVEGYLEQNPSNRVALRAAADLAVGQVDYSRAEAILTWLRDNGGQRDVRLLADLALVQTGLGKDVAACSSAREAYGLQRASPEAAQALGFCLAAQGRERDTARALFAKAEARVGMTPLIAQGRAMLAARLRDS